MQYFTIPMRHWKVSFSFHLNHLVIHQPLSKVVYTQLKILACSVNLFHRVKITTHLSSPGASRSLGCATERMTVGITLMRGTVIQVGGDGDSGGDDDGDGDDRDGDDGGESDECGDNILWSKFVSWYSRQP